METIGARTAAGSFIVGIEREAGHGIERVDLHLAVEIGPKDSATLRDLIGVMIGEREGWFAGAVDTGARLGALMDELAEQQESFETS